VTASTDSALVGWESAPFTFDGTTRAVYRRGTGPCVIVIHEIPGITPDVADFASRVVDAGFSVTMPSLFGRPGRDVTGPYMVSMVASPCVSREFAAFALDHTAPIIHWLRALAAEEHGRAGGAGVGVVGMCFTGGFALGMMVDARVLAPVLSQPGCPFPITAKRRASLGVDPADLARIKERAAAGVCVLGLRFSGDATSPAARFETLRRELGDAFIGVEIDSSPGNPYGIATRAHSVLTNDFVDDPEHPTRHALDTVLQFLTEHLHPTE
jgi:dienelactone hydrolase